jgi:serine/threonine protein kinase
MVEGQARVGGLPEGIRESVVLAGKYRIGATLGAGAMGTVVSARHLLLKEDVAIKFLVADRWDQADAVERFVQEARAAVRIQSEHVVRVLDVAILESGAPYIVMELLQGHDLAARLRQGGPVPANEAVGFLLQACDAIGASHRLGIVHRDIKPANLFLAERVGEKPILKVLDFGISKSTRLVPITADVEGTLQSARMTGARAILGSPFYMSPEQMESARDVDGRTDIWALGVTLFELVTGAPPFRGSSLVEVYSKMMSKDGGEAWRAELAKVEPSLEEVLARCLARDPAGRFATAGELAGSLATFASKGPSAPRARHSPSGPSDSNSGVERAPALARRRESGRPSGGRSLLVAVLGGFVGSAIFVLCAHAKSGVDEARAPRSPLAVPAPSAASAVPAPSAASAVPAPSVASAVPAPSSAPAVSGVTSGSVVAKVTSGSSLRPRASAHRLDIATPPSPSASTAAKVQAAPAAIGQAVAPAPPASSFSPQQVSDLLRSRE